MATSVPVHLCMGAGRYSLQNLSHGMHPAPLLTFRLHVASIFEHCVAEDDPRFGPSARRCRWMRTDSAHAHHPAPQRTDSSRGRLRHLQGQLRQKQRQQQGGSAASKMSSSASAPRSPSAAPSWSISSSQRASMVSSLPMCCAMHAKVLHECFRS